VTVLEVDEIARGGDSGVHGFGCGTRSETFSRADARLTEHAGNLLGDSAVLGSRRMRPAGGHLAGLEEVLGERRLFLVGELGRELLVLVVLLVL
jgi:hypothetical protein